MRSARITLLALVAGAAYATGSRLRKAPLALRSQLQKVAITDFDTVLRQASSTNGKGEYVSPCANDVAVLMNNQAKKAVADECEHSSAFSAKALNVLQQGHELQALKLVSQSLQNCGQISQQCATELAPEVVQKLQFAGMGVTKTCWDQYHAIHKDRQMAAKAKKCEKDNGFVKEVFSAVMAGHGEPDLFGGAEITRRFLNHCSHIESPCDDQLAPVIVAGMIAYSKKSLHKLMEEKEKNIARLKNAGDEGLTVDEGDAQGGDDDWDDDATTPGPSGDDPSNAAADAADDQAASQQSTVVQPSEDDWSDEPPEEAPQAVTAEDAQDPDDDVDSS
eukprot:gnl/TRDRNA2_/TRDRNA2_35329_c0_seq1.p1 gnl/TRDRNA2_/TRDRNA2_35329_c0~~gnl/TRDRNA2_/TRDRNA2_35329_c0_seq1.p1  ORF type:complete len:355 (+),score=79.59 gnl/TRDRNA2_/TRDRNA2_35329_c0_seq1:64-1065(+)